MQASNIQTLITTAISDYGIAMLAIVGAVLVVIVGFYVFRMGIMYFSGMAFGDGMTITQKDKDEYWEWNERNS